MLLPVFGSAGNVSEFALQAVTALAEAAVGPHQLISANTGVDFSSAWNARQSDDVIAFSDSPDAELVELFSHADIPCSVFLESGRSIVETVWKVASTDLWPFRIREASLAALHDLALAPSAMIVSSDARGGRSKLLTSLAAHYHLPLTNDQLAGAMAKLGPGGGPEAPLIEVPPLPLQEGAAAPDSDWREHLSETLAGFAPLLDQQRVDTLTWPRQILLTIKGDKTEPVTGPIDLTGPARTLIWGPYLNLPKGRWSVRPTFACARNLAGCRMGVDIYAETVRAASDFVLPEEGTYSFELAFDIAEPRQAIELRFFLREGLIDGIFDLQSVSLSRSV